MLHSDQGDSALQGAHDAQDGCCAECGERYGWWQGVISEENNGAEWICAVCAALWNEVPPPDSHVRLAIHSSFWDAFGLGQPENAVTWLRHHAGALSYLVAWSFETSWLSSTAFMADNVLIPNNLWPAWEKSLVPPDELWPVLLRKPVWWARHSWPETWAYIEGRENDLFNAIMREALGLSEKDEWWRSCYSNDSTRWDGWTGALPGSHPRRSEGNGWAFHLPWSLIRRRALNEHREIEGQAFDRDCIRRVEAGVLAALQSMRCPSNLEPPPLWEAIGIPGIYRGPMYEP